MSIQLGRYFLDPEVQLGPSEIPKKEHGSGHQVMHHPSLFVDPLIDAPTGHKLLHFVVISCENFWFFSDHLV